MRKERGAVGAELREFNDQDDHVHLLAGYPPKAAVPAPVNSLNGVPARRIRSEATGRVNRHIRYGHFWSPSSFAASRRIPPRCAAVRRGAPLSIIQQHIEQQTTPVSATSGLTPP